MMYFAYFLYLSACSYSGEVKPDIACESTCEQDKEDCVKSCETECANASHDGDSACDTDCTTTCGDDYDQCNVTCTEA